MKLFDGWFRKKTAPGSDYDEVASIIEAFVEGRSGQWDWDEFTSIKKKDPYLESIRARCVKIPSEHPPKVPGAYCDREGLEVLLALARTIREKMPDRSGAEKA